MLGDKEAVATIAVKDMEAARKFYEDKLRLKKEPTKESGVLAYKSGGTTLLVYQSQYAGTNKATAATWVVGGDVETEVQALKDRGVTFEHYQMPGMTQKGDIHVAGSMKAAWFKDPDGNILALVSG
jgi:catechol 2,3-dioxygenase-like lactoylglutathione lyase family enzyme